MSLHFCSSTERSGLHGGLDPVFHPSPLPSLSSGQHRPQLAPGRPFPSECFASALSSVQELISTPTPIPVSRGGSPSNGIWWKLFPAPQAESITLSFLSKHSTSPLLEHPSYCDLNVSSLLIQHKTPRCLMAGTLSDPALWRFASALNA